MYKQYTAKILYVQDDKRFDQEYWGQLKRNWRCWKSGQQKKSVNTEL